MASVVCTLFEGDYHYGVGALTNSLYAHGFRGTIYIGYRGALPPWVTNKTELGKQGLEMRTDFSPTDGLTLRFIALTTKVHLTNYKPDFMLDVWEQQCPEAEAMFYFDPDITIKCRWTFFEEWVDAGVGVCADVNPSMPDNHPIRHAWRKLLEPHALHFRNQLDTYFNCGFVGLGKAGKEFLTDWQHIQNLMGKCGADFQSLGVGDRTEPFTCRDQDALNITCMTTSQLISPIGQDGMDFQFGGGGYVMSHAIGGIKPWRKKMLMHLFRTGQRPSRADKQYYKNISSPIPVLAGFRKLLQKCDLLLASGIGRFIG